MKGLYYIVFTMILSNCGNLSTRQPIEIGVREQISGRTEKVSLNDKSMLEKSNGKFVEVEGIFRFNFEDVALYPSKRSRSINAIWLNLEVLNSIPDSLFNELRDKKVTVIGKINFAYKGHDNAYLATLDSAYYIREKK